MKLTPWRRRGALSTTEPDFDDLISRFWNGENGGLFRHLPETFQRASFPPVNVAEGEDAYTVTVDCPGMNEDEIDIELLGSNLIIRGERTWKDETKKKEYHRVESQVGTFERAVALPQDARLEPEAIEAAYDKGVLTIEIPKVATTPASKIPIRT